MSVLCPSNLPATNRAGFTLLEVLVVLTIIGLVAAASVPRLAVMYDSVAFTFERETFEQDLSALPYQAYRLGTDLVLRSDKPQASDDITTRLVSIAIPEGWKVEVPQPIYYRSSGFCTGGSITVTAGQISERYRLASPLCAAEVIP